MKKVEKTMLGKKIGMTSVFSQEGVVIPVTVVKCGPCSVVSIKTKDKDGYDAIQLGFESIEERKLSKPRKGIFSKFNIDFKRYLREFRDVSIQYNIGDIVNVDLFATGDRVQVSGISKGKGFQGVVKRHHFSGVGMQTHGQHNRQRHPGSIGSSSDPSKVFKGLKMAGQMGNKRATIKNVEIVDVLVEKNIILFKGGLPGSTNSLLEIIKLVG